MYKRQKPDGDIVVTKWIALEGTSIAAKEREEQLRRRFPAYLVEAAKGFDKYLSIIPEAAVAGKSGVWAMTDVTEGGILDVYKRQVQLLSFLH